ncbi:LuxR C-terminal-related transcriptional regulator [Spirillospora sp. CA-294931]|uniref:LuxR C-terminal-related transcriptional regulator n=1 Tax=Spirillospora sp. CA-294931 TaxID=3240042 RepID=UPI003D8CBB20
MVERRDALVARLGALVGRAPVVILVGGAAGMGKSWLVERVLAVAGAGRPVVVGCRGLPSGAHVLTRELVAGVVEAGGDGALAERASAAIENADADEYRVCAEVRALLGAARTTVVVEDVEAADVGSRQVLRYLATRPPAGLVLLLTHAASAAPLGGRLGTTALGAVCRVELGPLDVPEVAAIASGITGTPVPDEWAGQVRRLTGGVPLFVLEVLKRVRPGDGEPEGALSRRGMPPVIAEIAEERLAALPPAVRRVVTVAALVRGPVAAPLLAGACGLAPEKVERALLSAVDAGVLVGRGGSAGFHPPLLAAVIRDGMPAGDRVRGHALIAGAFERQDGDAALAELVHHSRAAGDLAAAARYAERIAALDDDHTDHTVRLLQGLLREPALPAPARDALAGRLGRLALNSLAYDETIALLREIVTDGRLPAGLRGELRLSLALVLKNQAGEGEAGRLELIRAVGELRRRPALAARAMSALAHPYWGRSPLAEHLEWQAEAERIVPERGDPALLTAVAVNRAAVLMLVGDPGAWTVAAALPEDGSTAGEREQLLRGYSNLADAAMSLGHHAAAGDFLAKAGRLARRTGPSYPARLATGTGLRMDLASGRWSGLAERARRHLDAAANTPYAVSDAVLVLAQLALARGEWDEAEEFLRAPSLQVTGGWCGPSVTTGAATRIRLAVLRDRLPDALAELAAALELVGDKGGWVWSAELVEAAVDALLRAGDRDRARRVVGECEAGVRDRDAPFAHALLGHCHAMIAAVEGRIPQAVAMFTTAADGMAALARPYERARALEAAARCLIDTDPGRALAPAARAAEVFTELGATWDAARCGHLVREHGGASGGRRGRRGYGRELSPRELDVARLLASGRTNKQIAEVLFLSPRTVERHVASVLRKLGTTRNAVRVPD